jgi:threonine 3-dehydrogenase
VEEEDMAKMRAVMKVGLAPGAELREVDVPKPGPRDLLVKVRAAAICGTDIHINEWTDYAQARVKPPMIFGHEYCGEVVATGDQVHRVRMGDLVAAETHIPCGQCAQCMTGNMHICEQMRIIGVHTDGAFADYAVLPESCAWVLPPDSDPELGAVLEPMGVGVHGVLVDRVDARSVAIFGCGPIGLFAVGTALTAGASQVLALEIAPYRLELARRLFPEAVVLNPLEEDAERIVHERTEGRGVDVSVELSGSAAATRQCFQILRKGGRVSLVGLGGDVTLNPTADIIYREAQVYGVTGRVMWETWYQIMDIIASGRFDPTEIITHRFSLGEYARALELAKSGEAGKILLLP